MTVGLPTNATPSYLTLSAAGELDPQADRSVTRPVGPALRGSQAAVEPVSHIRAELRRITTARRHGAKRTARVHLDRLIDYVWFSDPDSAA